MFGRNLEMSGQGKRVHDTSCMLERLRWWNLWVDLTWVSLETQGLIKGLLLWVRGDEALKL